MLGRYDEALVERPSFRHFKGFMLARVGRYREAEQLIAQDIGDAEANKNIVELGKLHLLSAVLALERKQPALAGEHLHPPERLFAQATAEQRRFYSVAAHTLGGLAALQAGRIDEARSHLNDQSRIVKQVSAPETWWHKLLEGEIALAQGDPQKAAAAFSAGEPRGKMWLHLNTLHIPLLANDLPSRDGLGACGESAGRFCGSDSNLPPSADDWSEPKWTAMYEPRYVLEIARLLDQSGDRRSIEGIRTLSGVLEKRRQRSARACRSKRAIADSALLFQRANHVDRLCPARRSHRCVGFILAKNPVGWVVLTELCARPDSAHQPLIGMTVRVEQQMTNLVCDGTSEKLTKIDFGAASDEPDQIHKHSGKI